MTEKDDIRNIGTKNESQEENELKTQQRSEAKIMAHVADYLRNLGMPSHLKGYFYVRDAIVMMVKRPEKLYMITKEVYPYIAKKRGVTVASVERSIRNAIEVSWERAVPEIVSKIFCCSKRSQKKRPSNLEYIAQIADYININDKI